MAVLGGSVGIAGCTEDAGTDEAAEAEETPTPDEETPTPEQDDDETPEPEEETPTPEPEQEGDLETNAIGYPSEYIEIHDVVYDERRDEDFEDPIVSGVVENVHDGELDYVQVEIQAFDEDDVQIADGLDNTNNLREERSWQFECMLWDVDPDDIDHWMGRASVTVW